MREQSKEGKRSIKVNEKTKKVRKPKCLKADDSSPRKEREEQSKKRRSPERKVVEQGTTSSDSTQEDSEDEESDSDDSSEDEEDRDSSESEQKSSNEEEETEPDDECSPDTSEEEVKRKPASPYVKERVTEIGGRRGKRVKIAVGSPDLPGHEDQSSPHSRGNNKEHDTQSKKRSRRRYKESSMSPTTRDSYSPSTSQEENQRKRATKWITKPKRKRKNLKKGKESAMNRENIKEGSSISTEGDNSSPECDMLKDISETESKSLSKVFKRFFGRLCVAIKTPVEFATLLQMKGLLTYSEMKKLLMSSESKQAKTITLVRALQKKIKSNPDRIFNIIEVFLHDEVLQHTGREMWTETGENVFKWLYGRDTMNYSFMQEKYVLKYQPLCLVVSYLPMETKK